ncbi:hypothetical protein LIER_00660 [Lithospermum erythrorhizon]|uniref:t-SNARE coiled-coil homology domain-containing protein n=1 Tax=Lithospermum erythrorhizon TaxID=34254 RepID=A0AAV3NJN6_LITER
MEVILKDSTIYDNVLEFTKAAQQKGADPLFYALQVYTKLSSNGVILPSLELANLLVSHICWNNNVPIMWKFLDKALELKVVHPLIILALLSIRVIPSRHLKPAAFRIYLELIKKHGFDLKDQVQMPNYQETLILVDAVLSFSRIFGIQANDSGVFVVMTMFSIVWQLLDASLDDEGLLELTIERRSIWPTRPSDMEVDISSDRAGCGEQLKNLNAILMIKLIGQFLQNKLTSRILFLARENMPSHWSGFIKRLHLLLTNSSTLEDSQYMSLKSVEQSSADMRNMMLKICTQSSSQGLITSTVSRTLDSCVGLCLGFSPSAIWLPLDLVLEDAMDASQVNASSAVETLTGLVKTLQAINCTTWHDAFLGLWMSALRLVQRERDPIEGPVPHLDARLCMLLSITILVVADLIEEEGIDPTSETESGTCNFSGDQVPGQRHKDFVSSIQRLGDYESLLIPPQSVCFATKQAAAKAMMFISGINVGNAYFECISMSEMPINCSGNLRHLIVESCIARGLLDTSAYFWPGYVNGGVTQLPQGVPSEVPGWSSFVKGAPLTPTMINALASVPASSLGELEKIFQIADKGSDDEKMAAASILCGASLSRGWNVQEHTVYYITRLLSPPVPPDFSGNSSHLISYGPMLNVLLAGIGPIDYVKMFSLHGLVPQLAGSLMTICEVFGSCVPNVPWNLATGEEITVHTVFSNAFALLLKLWRFNHPPLEYRVGDVPPVGAQLTPEYLLSVRNFHLMSSGNIKDPNRRRLAAVANSSSAKPIFVDSFPKLKVWYRQHLACIASPLSGLINGTPVHQTVDALLNMIFKKVNKGSQSFSTGSSSSAGSGNEDASLRPKLPAWDILEAVPFVVDAALTACAHRILSPRALCTGLKDLADHLPASLATIVSFLSAEVTRGVWKPVTMNGSDWPSPAANLSNVEGQIKKILAATGVDVPSFATGGSSSATLPLPLAAFVSLTITYKLDKASQHFLDLAGPALESLAAGCPWPCMPIVTSLWTQKAKRWSDFLVFSASRTVFLHNNDAAVQLLRSCFNATLGLNTSSISIHGGVGALLGHGFGSHFGGGISPVAPGILYLRVYRSIRDIMFLREEIISLLLQSVSDLLNAGAFRGRLDTRKIPSRLKNHRVSLPTGMTEVKLAASLGASLVWISGGSGLVQSLIKETLPSWFISCHRPEQEGTTDRLLPMLKGVALAYLAVLCGAFAWGIDSSSSASKRRSNIVSPHMEFLASAMEGKISLGCDPATWCAYVTGFLSLIVRCTPSWVLEVDEKLLERLSKGLRQWNEKELAVNLLGLGGVGAMGSAARLIIDN